METRIPAAPSHCSPAGIADQTEPSSIETHQDQPAGEEPGQARHDELVPKRLALLDQGLDPLVEQSRIIAGERSGDQKKRPEEKDKESPRRWPSKPPG
jgi:hypothetical protein